ncbi:hypothetical protein JOC77_000853 [Peribacillus deserti]|uniref:Uncharacterized protein n=1 Tax=Peribacillus deserti TaxID=673318 RepID=A0ABS2QG04_9BACI|nr:hypothetical protein [Peribacillus deserti]MBM7691448.1 hypothetical protein [Peribacillus deserti]
MYRKIFSQFIVICIFIFTGQYLAHASSEWQDPNVPISFKLKVLPWNEARTIIPRKSIFTLIDVQTGLQFKVQRRAGSQHADVQPLTAHDTSIMKKIYGGKWSWKRRAIIVLVDDHMIAASMHGMPHGAGALQNKFPGHFCVHFYGSTTHRLNNEDPIHKLMIMKAGGKDVTYLNTLDPYELIHLFTLAVNMRDQNLLKIVMPQYGAVACAKEQIKGISFISLLSHQGQTKAEDGIVATEIPVKAAYSSKKHGKQKRMLNLILIREDLTGRWQIDGTSLCEEIDENNH